MVASSKFVILLSACVNPDGMSYTLLSNPEIRQKQYLEALEYYLTHTPYSIVVCENTQTRFIPSTMLDTYADRLEFLTFDGNRFDKTLGKGYGEAIIIEHALNHSVFCKDADYIIKITGRLIIRNFQTLLSSGFLFHSPLRKYVIADMHTPLTMCNSFFLVAHKEFWQNYFCPAKEKLNDSRNFTFEHLLAQKILEWRKKHAFRQFFFYIDKVGVSGTTALIYRKKKISCVYWLRAMLIYVRLLKH